MFDRINTKKELERGTLESDYKALDHSLAEAQRLGFNMRFGPHLLLRIGACVLTPRRVVAASDSLVTKAREEHQRIQEEKKHLAVLRAALSLPDEDQVADLSYNSSQLNPKIKIHSDVRLPPHTPHGTARHARLMFFVGIGRDRWVRWAW